MLLSQSILRSGFRIFQKCSFQRCTQVQAQVAQAHCWQISSNWSLISLSSEKITSSFSSGRGLHTAAGCGGCLRSRHREADDYDTPVKYSTSKAARYASPQTFLNPRRSKAPWYQGYSVLASTAVFLIYFLYLREENDWDEELKTSIYSRVKGLDEVSTETALEHAQKMGQDSTELKAHLESIQKDKKG